MAQFVINSSLYVKTDISINVFFLHCLQGGAARQYDQILNVVVHATFFFLINYGFFGDAFHCLSVLAEPGGSLTVSQQFICPSSSLFLNVNVCYGIFTLWKTIIQNVTCYTSQYSRSMEFWTHCTDLLNKSNICINQYEFFVIIVTLNLFPCFEILTP